MRIKEKFDKKLLVEGSNDKHVVWALCEKYNISETFDIIDCGSVDEVYKAIPLRFKEHNVDTIGIVVDADTDINSRWTSLKGILQKVGFDISNEFPKTGLIRESEDKTKKVGVWIMPNNETSGMLEDFISFLIPENDIKNTNLVLDNVEEKCLNKYKSIHKSKALIHSWLSWQENPGTPMGLAITKKYLATEEENCQNFITWLQKLFMS